MTLRSKVFEKVESFSNAEFDKFSTSSLITRTTNDITQIQMLTVMMIPRASVSAERIADVLATEPTIEDGKGALKQETKGLLEFKNVSFRYPGSAENVLSNISFTAIPGETTAFIGSTGCGKSTLVNLIPRFYDVSEGEICIDGEDIRNHKLESLRSLLGYVPQKGVLFSGDIESNLKYADENATDEAMEKAAEIAQATEFINSRDVRFKAQIAQGGNNVSGGQKQRLSIARALLKSPPIYIFDDSFSALDYKTDTLLREALKRETGNSTVILVAQRLSTIMTAEKIIVLDHGRIVGMGSHEELLKNCEVYKEIAYSQLSEEELS